MKNKIWIDLTDMATWSGQHGGTQRVVYGIAEEYFKHDDTGSVQYCVFDERTQEFYSFDFEILRERVAKVAQQTESNALSQKRSAKQAVIENIPQIILANDTLRHVGKKVLKTTYVSARKGYRVLKHAAVHIKVEHKRNPVEFARNDTVFLPGKPWDSPKLLPTLAKMKSVQGFRVAAVLYDMIIPLYPHLHADTLFKPYTQCMFELAQTADVLLPISKSTEKDFTVFCEKLALPCPPQHVIRLGDRLEDVRKAVKPDGPIAEDFILSVGTIEVRKNHALLYYVYKLAQEKGIELPQLVIVGRPGWNAKDIYKIIKGDKSVRNKLLIMESISDAQLAWLYEHCLFTVFPSMYEGWGLPVAESLLYGKLCLASNTSSMFEIAGNLADYFSPYNSEQCLKIIEKYLDPKNLLPKQSSIVKGYSPTTWAHTYEQVAAYVDSP